MIAIPAGAALLALARMRFAGEWTSSATVAFAIVMLVLAGPLLMPSHRRLARKHAEGGGRLSATMHWMTGTIGVIIAVFGVLIVVLLATSAVVRLLKLDSGGVALAGGALWIALAVGGFALVGRAKRQ